MTLLDFLRDWLEWAETTPLSNRYSPKCGLCASLGRFTMQGNFLQDEKLRIKIRDELFALFNAQYAYGTRDSEWDRNTNAYPFGGRDMHNHEKNHSTAHKNPARLAWVRKTIKELKNEQAQG